MSPSFGLMQYITVIVQVWPVSTKRNNPRPSATTHFLPSVPWPRLEWSVSLSPALYTASRTLLSLFCRSAGRPSLKCELSFSLFCSPFTSKVQLVPSVGEAGNHTTICFREVAINGRLQYIRTYTQGGVPGDPITIKDPINLLVTH